MIPGSTTKPAAESGHWYDENGTLIETVPYSDGRPGKRVTLREARMWNLCPGVTSIIKEMASPGLERWKRSQVLLEAATCPRLDGESDAAWIARVEFNAGEKGREAREEGTRIHAAIEQFYSNKPWDAAYDDHVRGANQTLLDILGPQTWMAEKSVVHPYGYATKVDMWSDQGWIVDWKGCDGGLEELAEKRTFKEHWMQLAACKYALRRPEARAAICYVSRTNPGANRFIEVMPGELRRGWEMFKGALRIWQESRNYYPNWVSEEWRDQ